MTRDKLPRVFVILLKLLVELVALLIICVLSVLFFPDTSMSADAGSSGNKTDRIEIKDTPEKEEKVSEVKTDIRENENKEYEVTKTENSGSIDEKTFLEKFVEAVKANDKAKIAELVKKGEAVIFTVVNFLTAEGIRLKTTGEESTQYFNAAKIIAAAYEREFKRNGLLELVRKYASYSPDLCKEKLKSDELLDEGLSLHENRRGQDALDKYLEALEIFRRIGDVAGEGAALTNIGLVYHSMGRYEEALNYYDKSLVIFRDIGINAQEAKVLLNIGSVYYELSRYTDALNYYKQYLEFSRKIGNMAGEEAALKGIVIGYDRSGQYADALSYYEQLLVIKKKIGDIAEAAEILLNIGDIYRKLGRYAEALNYYKQELEIKKKIGDTTGEAIALAMIGISYADLRQYSEALNYHKQSLEIAKRIGDTAGESINLTAIGLVYIQIGKCTEALKYFELALELKGEIGDIVGKVAILSNIGIAYEKLGQYTEALKYHKQAFEMAKNVEDVVGEVRSLRDIGCVYYELGQYTEALNYHRDAFEVAKKAGDAAGEVSPLTNIGIIYDKLGQYTEALKYHKQALEIAKKIGDFSGEVATLTNIGVIYHELGRYSEALNYQKEALEMVKKTGDVTAEAKSLTDIGIYYFGLGQYAEAMDYYRQSLEFKRKIGDTAGEADVLANIGLVYIQLGQYDRSIQSFQEAAKISEKLGILETVWRAQVGVGNSLWKSGNGEEAIAHYQKAIETIEELYRLTIGLKEEERSSMMGNKAHVYQKFIELLLELHKKHPDKGYDKQAFMVSEKSKSRVFQEMMAKAGARTAFAGDEAFKGMIEKGQQLIGELASLKGSLAKEFSKPEAQRSKEIIESLQTQISSAEKELSVHEKEMEVKYPRYADLKRPKPLSVEELQGVLNPDETVLAYAVGKDKTAVFVIGKERFKLIELPVGKEEIAELVRSFMKGLNDIGGVTWDKDLRKFNPGSAYGLYQKVFEPVSSELRGITKLYISGDDLLYTVPFEAMVDRYNEDTFGEARAKGNKDGGSFLGEYATLHYLIDTYTIAYLPSASVLRSLRKYEKPGYGKWSKPIIAFADPVFSAEEDSEDKDGKGVKQRGISKETELSMDILTRSTGGAKLKRLKESSEEARAIEKELQGKEEDLYMRQQAKEDNVYSAKLKDAQYILFSTHGLLGGDFSGIAEPTLALTLIDNPPGRDGFLTMSKVLGLDLNAEIVILSACNTSGRGDKTGNGEGFAGLTRSFMYAGSKSLLVTHWSVESNAARDLMVETIRGMKEKKRDEALREAKLKMKGSSRQMGKANVSLSHPFFWAPFVLVGEGE